MAPSYKHYESFPVPTVKHVLGAEIASGRLKRLREPVPDHVTHAARSPGWLGNLLSRKIKIKFLGGNLDFPSAETISFQKKPNTLTESFCLKNSLHCICVAGPGCWRNMVLTLPLSGAFQPKTCCFKVLSTSRHQQSNFWKTSAMILTLK